MAKKFERIMPGVYLVGRTDSNPGIVYFRKMFNGKRVIRKASVQGALALDVKGRPTRQLKAEAANWAASGMNKAFMEKRQGLPEMTFEKLLEEYKKAAELERIKSGKPTRETVRTACVGVGRIVGEAGLKMSDRCSKMTADMIDVTIAMMVKKGLKKITAWSYALGLQMATARWTRAYYRRAGYEPTVIELPTKRNMRPPRYERPTKEQLEEVGKWYEGLWKEEDKRKWLAATMMLQFAMRNGDVQRATRGMFEKRLVKTRSGETVERMIISYKPHKTSSSSGRTVAWPIAQSIWERIRQAEKEIEMKFADNGRWKGYEDEKKKLVPFAGALFARMNEELRKIFKDRSKACYELRKICVDHVYQTLGPGKASAISGDDLKTVSYYYADPSQALDEEGLDIAELL